MPNFEQEPVNYAAEYARALADAYPYLSYFGAVWGSDNSMNFRPGYGATVYIPSIRVKGAHFTNRDQITGVFTRNTNNNLQAVELDMDREWDDMVDPMDVDETNMVLSIANATRAFNEQQKIPEMDAYLASKLGGFASMYGNTDATSLSTANILATWDKYLAEMTSRRVNRRNVVAYMTPDTYLLLKEAAGVTRFVSTDEGFRGVDRNVARLDGVTIVEVPPDMMKSAYDFEQGWAVASGAKQINLLMVDPLAVAAPVKYEASMMGAPTVQSKGKYLYYERYYYGAFSLMERGAGIFANMSAAASLGTLTVASAAGTVNDGDTVITVTGDILYSNGVAPYGYALYYTSGQDAAVALTYGSTLPGTATWAQLPGNPATLASQTASKYITVALVETVTGKVVAGGNTTMLVKA